VNRTSHNVVNDITTITLSLGDDATPEVHDAYAETAKTLTTAFDVCFNAWRRMHANEDVDLISLQREVLGYVPEFQVT
jgi:hypothetical protein